MRSNTFRREKSRKTDTNPFQSVVLFITIYDGATKICTEVAENFVIICQIVSLICYVNITLNVYMCNCHYNELKRCIVYVKCDSFIHRINETKRIFFTIETNRMHRMH